jgi:hypothetical protein
MRHKKYDFRTAFIDLLINVLTGVVFLFMIASLLIQTKVKDQDQGVKKDAQYVIQMSWPNNMNCDVDIWVRDPADRVVSYQAKDVDIMHLERDDQGWTNDTTLLSMKAESQLPNTETWVLRGKLAGRFTVNIHLYSCTIENKSLDLGSQINVPVNIELLKLNPNVKKLVTKTYVLNQVWQEITVFNFILDKNNNVIDITDEQIDLVREKR